MKITKKHILTPKKRTILIVCSAVVVIGGGAAMTLYHIGPFAQKNSPVNLQPATKEQQDAGIQTKQNSANAGAKSTSTGSDQPAAPVPQPSGKSTVSTSITAANQNNNLLQVRTLIGAVSADGTCTLTLTKGSSTVTKTAAVQALATSSTCQGFDIPMSELSTGVWNITLNFENSSIQGSATSTVTLQ